MPHKQALTLSIAGGKDFLWPGSLVSLLVVISALLSPHPMLMTFFVIFLLGAGWYLYIAGLFEVAGIDSTLAIFPDASLQIESGQRSGTEGVLSGQQWCNSRFAVLRYTTGGKPHHLVLLSAQQNADHYRRLMVWLRQDLLLKSEGRVQS